MNVEQLAAARGRSVEDVLAACKAANVLAWSGFTPLDEAEVASVDRALQGSPDGAFAAPGAGGAPSMPMPPPTPGTALPPSGWVPQGAYQAVPPSKGRNPLVVLGMVIAALVVIGVALNATGVVDTVQEEATRNAVADVQGADFDDDVAEELASYALVVGDCFDNRSDPILATESVQALLDEVPCDGPHDAEVYRIVDHPDPVDAPYPGDQGMVDFALFECTPAFHTFVGIPLETSTLDIIFVHPEEEGWTLIDDRRLVCAVMALDGSPLTGTMAGSAR